MSRRAEFLQRIKSPKRPSHGTFDDWLLDRELEGCAKQNGDSAGAERFCECPETLVNGERIAVSRFHSCEYVRARSALVPQAVAVADARVVIHPASEDQGRSQARWVKCFAVDMEKLSRPLLNGASSKQAA